MTNHAHNYSRCLLLDLHPADPTRVAPAPQGRLQEAPRVPAAWNSWPRASGTWAPGQRTHCAHRWVDLCKCNRYVLTIYNIYIYIYYIIYIYIYYNTYYKFRTYLYLYHPSFSPAELMELSLPSCLAMESKNTNIDDI